MLGGLIETINQGIYAGLLILGAYLVLMNIKTLLLPQKTGTLIAFGAEGSSSETVMHEMQKYSRGCKGCSLAETVDGKMAFPVQVRLKDNSVMTAEVSPCTLCIDRLKIGDKVGITEMGSRKVIQKAGLIAGVRG